LDELLKGIFTIEYFDAKETTNEFTNSILNNISVFVFIFDAEKMVPVWINKYFQKRMGYTNEDLKELKADDFLGLFHPVSQKQFQRKIRSFEFIENNDEKNLYELKTRHEEWIYMLVCSKVSKRNPDGKVKYIIGYGVEINRSELKHHLHKMKDLDTTCYNLSLIQNLSTREVEIIKLIAHGMTDREIAQEFNLSIHTTKTHRKRIISKLGLKNSVMLVKFAFENGLI
jgi:DNA-binding CsgD family transcriptional regulator